MRLTRLGALIILAAGVTFCGALISANNLLYLVFSLLVSSLLLSVWLNVRNLAHLSFRARPPDQVFRDKPFDLELEVRNEKGRPAFQVHVVSEGVRRAVDRLAGRGSAVVTVPAVCTRRGRNALEALTVESGYPFGFFWGRRKVRGLVVTAYPAVYDLYGRETAAAGFREEPVSLPRRGVGEEFYGVREYRGDEDARLISWKLTAKTGMPLVQEYSQPAGRKVTLTVEGTPGPETEARVAECASLARFHIDAGAEVRLLTDEGDSGFGRGLLHLDRLLNALALLGEGKEVRPAVRPRPKKRARLVLHQSSWLLGLTSATTAVVALSLLLIEEMSWLTVLPLALVLPLGRMFDRRKKHPLPKFLFDIAAVLYVLFFIFVDLPASGTLQAVTRLVVFILVYLLMNPKRERQVYQLFLADFLVFFLVSGQAVSPLYFFFLVAYFLCAFLWLVKWQEEAPTLRTSVRPAGLAALTTACLVLASGMFILMPRLTSARMQQLLANAGLSRWRAGLHSLEGLSGEVELGYFGPLRENTTRALRASYLDAGGRTVRPPVARIRAASFDEFDGRRWSRSRREFRFRLAGSVLESRDGQVRIRGRQGRVDLTGKAGGIPEMTEEYFVYPMAGAFLFSRGGPLALESGVRAVYLDWTDTISLSSFYSQGTRYRLFSRKAPADFFRHVEDYGLILQSFLQLPDDDLRLGDLAERVTAGRSGPLAKAEAIESHLRSRYQYSAEPEHGRQTIGEFLRRTRAGNCEYFATAMCLLLRKADVPSRLAIGFLTDDWNEYGGFYDVRQSDAHAWVEAFIPGRGWMTFDPTPPASAARAGGGFLGGLIRRFRDYFSAVEVRWYRYVVGYDRFTQRGVYGRLSLEVGRNLARTLVILGAIVGTVLLLRTVKPWRLLERRKRRRARNGNFYYGLLDAFERKGFRREPWRTGMEFAEEVVVRRPDLEPLKSITASFYRVRFGGRGLEPGELSEVEAACRRLAKKL